jgi:hypothetical protein
MPGESKSICPKRIRFQNLRTGLQVLFVDGQDQVGVRQVQLVVAAIDEDAARVEHGSHGAVGKHRAAGKDVGKLGHSVAMLSQPPRPRQSRGSLCYTSRVISWYETGSGRPRFSIAEPDLLRDFIGQTSCRTPSDRKHSDGKQLRIASPSGSFRVNSSR